MVAFSIHSENEMKNPSFDPNPQSAELQTVTSKVSRGVLTLLDVARILRCSKAHVCNIVHGRVRDLPPLPVVRIGRRVLIRDESLNLWMRAVEHQTAGVR